MIRPMVDINILPNKENILIDYETGGRYIEKKKINKNPDGSVFRIDTVKNYIDDRYICKHSSLYNEKDVYKNNINKYDSKLNISNVLNEIESSYCVIDSSSGEVLNHGSDAPYPAINEVNSWVFSGNPYPPLTPHALIFKQDNINTNNYIGTPSTCKMTSALNEIYSFEDEYEMSFVDLIGSLEVFFTQWNNVIPIEARVCIDATNGTYNIINFKYMSGILDKTAKYIYLEFMKALSRFSKLLYSNCVKEKRKIRLDVYIGIHDCIIQIKDLDKRNISTIPLNTVNHFKYNILNCINGGLSYFSSEILDILKGNEFCWSITKSMLDNCSELVYTKDVLESIDNKIYD